MKHWNRLPGKVARLPFAISEISEGSEQPNLNAVSALFGAQISPSVPIPTFLLALNHH